MKVAELGEFGLIDRLNKDLIAIPNEVICGIGDDTAVLPAQDRGDLLFTTDMLVEDVHFSLGFSSPYQIGWKAIACSVSDIAAMGGRPSNATISLAIPRGIEVEFIDELYAGLRAAGQRYGVNIVGGDTVKTAGPIVVNVALLGWVECGRAVYRSGARPGDLIAVTGSLGDSAGGLKILKNDLSNLPAHKKEYLLNRHLEPQPQLQLGPALAQRGLVTAMNDVSDGLASEVLEITRASNVGCVLVDQDIPISVPLFRLAAQMNTDAVEMALFGGEDYQLVFTFAPDNLEVIEQIGAELGEEITVVGQITHREAGKIRRKGTNQEVNLEPMGYNHFR